MPRFTRSRWSLLCSGLRTVAILLGFALLLRAAAARCCCALLLRAACIQTRSLFCSGLRCCALLEGLHDLINFSGAGGSVEYTHNGVSIGWHIAKKPGLKTFVVQRAELQRANDKNILQTR